LFSFGALHNGEMSSDVDGTRIVLWKTLATFESPVDQLWSSISQGGGPWVERWEQTLSTPSNFPGLDLVSDRMGTWMAAFEDGYGLVVSRLDLGDDDSDGVPNAIEAAGPNGGDGNGDAISDSDQAGVTTLPAAAGGDYVTVEASGGCASLLDVQVTTEAQAPASDSGFDYPFGLVGFTAPCPSATVTIYFHGVSSLAAPYRKYGPTTPGDPGTAGWYSFPGAVLGSAFVGGENVATATLSLVDGALGDETGVDGQIVDPGGPAVRMLNGVPVPALGPMARLLLVVALAGMLALTRARRQRPRLHRDG
jgi:hypothetical protein